MPQRFLRPGIRTSEKWNKASFLAQSLYIGLVTLVDDFGRYDARAKLIHGEVFALRDDVKPQDSAAALQQLHDLGLVRLYSVEGKEFLQITNWQERARSEMSKFPEMPANAAFPAESCEPLRNPAESCLPRPKSSILDPRHKPSPAPPEGARVEMAKRIEDIHLWYSETRGGDIRLDDFSRRLWFEFFTAGHTEDDFKRVFKSKNGMVIAGDHPAAIHLKNLLAPDRFPDFLADAKNGAVKQPRAGGKPERKTHQFITDLEKEIERDK